jgi:putative transcription factor
MAHLGGQVGWDDQVVIGKRGPKGGTTLKSQAEVIAAQRKGLAVETEKKYEAGHNKQHGGPSNAVKLDQETEELKHEKLDLQVGKVIQQARNAKGLTQVELARQINEKQQIINEYEQAKAIPNQQILGKLERVLGVKLRGKGIGQPLSGPGPKK